MTPVADYLITIPPNWADTNYSHGQGKVDALLQTFMPNCQLPVLLVNDSDLRRLGWILQDGHCLDWGLLYEMIGRPIS